LDGHGGGRRRSGVIVGARMADRRRRLRMAWHRLARRAALEEARRRMEAAGLERRTRRAG
jgi:hypothetical protein